MATLGEKEEQFADLRGKREKVMSDKIKIQAMIRCVNLRLSICQYSASSAVIWLLDISVIANSTTYPFE